MSPSSNAQANRPPLSIAELAERAKASVWDPDKPLKHWLRTAEGARTAGKHYNENGDLENAFLELAKAATIVLEKLPTHKDYKVLLNPTQRHNMGQHGQKILDDLADIKRALLEQQENWSATQQSSALTQPSPYHAPTPSTLSITEGLVPRGNYPSVSPGSATTASPSASTPSSYRSRGSTAPTSAPGQGRRTRTPSPYQQSAQDDEVARRAKEDAVRRGSERRHEEDRGRYGPGPVSVPQGPSHQEEWARSEQRRLEREREVREQDAGRQGDRMREDETRRRTEEVRRIAEERRRQETDGIARRQQESEAAARAVRGQGPVFGDTMLQPAISLAMPTATHASMPAMSFPQTESRTTGGFLQMPLESPTRVDPAPKPSRTPILPPMTTTSPPPPSLGPIQYPSLMSQHQMKQGYTPSLASMFHQPAMQGSHRDSSGLLFLSEPSSSSTSLYSNPLPRPSMPVMPSTPIYGAPSAPHPYQPNQPSSSRPPPLPPKEPHAHSHSHAHRYNQHQRTESMRIEQSASDPVNRDLKTISFPRDCLHRFLSIAAINTREIGKRQHSTSDTCTMDEEELVMQFTEERSLITLGWIHTHPTQSWYKYDTGFMSSVDLHTHSGFQCMLPESFAVVCAPKSTPNFGIFRLTDPPGLQTILNCTVKEAFHPHPDCPIYTDADKGHVQIKDLALEIVDLR